MNQKELQKLQEAAQIGRVWLAGPGVPRLEAFSGNAIYLRRGMSDMNKYKTVKEVCDLTGLTRKHLYYSITKGSCGPWLMRITRCRDTTDIDSFDEYLDNAEAIEEFHIHIEDAASEIFVLICDYGASYAEMILQSAASAKDMYNTFEDFKDCIYEDACEIVKDEIYEDLLNAIKDYYYEGIINDARDSLPYSDWSDARSDAYSWWSDARGEVYGNWSDTRSDLYGFYTDMRSEL